MVDRIRYPTVSYLPFYYVFFQFLLLTIFNLQANILTTKDILSNLARTGGGFVVRGKASIVDIFMFLVAPYYKAMPGHFPALAGGQWRAVDIGSLHRGPAVFVLLPKGLLCLATTPVRAVLLCDQQHCSLWPATLLFVTSNTALCDQQHCSLWPATLLFVTSNTALCDHHWKNFTGNVGTWTSVAGNQSAAWLTTRPSCFPYWTQLCVFKYRFKFNAYMLILGNFPIIAEEGKLFVHIIIVSDTCY